MSINPNLFKSLKSNLKNMIFRFNTLEVCANQFEYSGDGLEILDSETYKEFYNRITHEAYSDILKNGKLYLEYYKDFNDNDEFKDGAFNSDKWSTQDFLKHSIILPSAVVKYIPYSNMYNSQEKIDLELELAVNIYKCILDIVSDSELMVKSAVFTC
jgi:hypothetical protein